MRYSLIILLLICTCYAVDYEQQFIELKQKLDTPEKVYVYLAKYISYQFVPSRQPYQSAYKTFLCGYGGCTDVAQFAYEVLTEHGYKCEIYEVWNRERGHSFCVVKEDDGTYRNMSVYRPRRYKFKTIEGIAWQQYPDLVDYKKVK